MHASLRQHHASFSTALQTIAIGLISTGVFGLAVWIGYHTEQEAQTNATRAASMNDAQEPRTLAATPRSGGVSTRPQLACSG